MVSKEPLLPEEMAVIDAWEQDVCRRADDVDPNQELHWESIFIGYAIAKGIPQDRAWELYYPHAYEREGHSDS